MSDSPRIPYLLWPVAIVLAFAIAYVVNVIERNWKRPPKSRPADWRAKLEINAEPSAGARLRADVEADGSCR